VALCRPLRGVWFAKGFVVGELSCAYDVVIVGGGPAGTTVASLLKKYDPAISVLIVEKSKFPREHVGESQLPGIGAVLDEMGVWDKVEAANFPIKIGATYRWGNSPDLWDFEFIPLNIYKDQGRPGKYEGQRRMTAWQVERAVYDDILLRHAESLGVEVWEETAMRSAEMDGDRIRSITLADGRTVTGEYVVDASGHVGAVRRAVGVGTTEPSRLRNMAVWDYWDNAEWAVEIGTGATRVQVLSLAGGWVWFIPLGPTRTSIGFVCPVEYYKERGLSPAELYAEAVKNEPRVASLTKNATRDNDVKTTKDWSFVADRLAGENWFLAGESAGFADPILAGGLLLTHTGAREVAYTILAMRNGDHDKQWLREVYAERQKKRVEQYIRFADYWYCANGQFTDLEDLTAEIAKDAGLDMSPKQAFRWLSLGGFAHEDFSFPGLGGLDLLAVKEITKVFADDDDDRSGWEINKHNTFHIDLSGSKKQPMPVFTQGKIMQVECFVRDGRWLPNVGLYGVLINVLRKHHDLPAIQRSLESVAQKQAARSGNSAGFYVTQGVSTLETMLVEGWVKGSMDPRRKTMIYTPMVKTNFHKNQDAMPEERG